MARKRFHSPQIAMATDEIRTILASRDAQLAEFERGIEKQRQAIIANHHADFIAAVGRALAIPGISQRHIQEAARATSWPVWVEIRNAAQIHVETRADSFTSAVIAYEIRPNTAEWQVFGLPKLAHWGDDFRMFKMRSHRYPHEIGRPDHVGNDTVVYNPTIEEVDVTEFAFEVANPAWGNTPNAPFGPARAEILSAIKAWIEKHPEAPE
jgi:hypothetical protein